MINKVTAKHNPMAFVDCQLYQLLCKNALTLPQAQCLHWNSRKPEGEMNRNETNSSKGLASSPPVFTTSQSPTQTHMESWNCIKLAMGSQPGDNKKTKGASGMLSLKLAVKSNIGRQLKGREAVDVQST